MDLENIMLSEISQRKQVLYITYMWNLKYNTNESIRKMEIDSQRKPIYDQQRGSGAGGTN